MIYSNYDYQVKVGNVSRFPDVDAAIQDYNLKQDFQYFINTNNTIKFGLKINHHTFKPGKMAASESNSTNFKEIENKYAFENGLYASHEIDISNRLKFVYGLRYSMFIGLGPGDVYTFDEDGDTI